MHTVIFGHISQTVIGEWIVIGVHDWASTFLALLAPSCPKAAFVVLILGLCFCGKAWFMYGLLGKCFKEPTSIKAYD